MPRDPAEPLLLTPGPVSTSRSVKSAMMRDRASGGDEFHVDLAHARAYMVGVVHGEGAYTAIPIPGSATYANEGVIAQLVPPGGKLLIHANGVYGDRLIEIAAHLGTSHAVIRTAPFTPPTTPGFAPRFLKPKTDRYLAQLMAVADGIMAFSDTWMSTAPSIGVLPIPGRRIVPEILRSLLNAIRAGNSLHIEYQSMNRERPDPLWRWVTPHALGSVASANCVCASPMRRRAQRST